jgi:hypothetical protein
MQKKRLGNYVLTSTKSLNFEIARGTIYQGINYSIKECTIKHSRKYGYWFPK